MPSNVKSPKLPLRPNWDAGSAKERKALRGGERAPWPAQATAAETLKAFNDWLNYYNQKTDEEQRLAALWRICLGRAQGAGSAMGSLRVHGKHYSRHPRYEEFLKIAVTNGPAPWIRTQKPDAPALDDKLREQMLLLAKHPDDAVLGSLLHYFGARMMWVVWDREGDDGQRLFLRTDIEPGTRVDEARAVEARAVLGEMWKVLVDRVLSDLDPNTMVYTSILDIMVCLSERYGTGWSDGRLSLGHQDFVPDFGQLGRLTGIETAFNRTLRAFRSQTVRTMLAEARNRNDGPVTLDEVREIIGAKTASQERFLGLFAKDMDAEALEELWEWSFYNLLEGSLLSYAQAFMITRLERGETLPETIATRIERMRSWGLGFKKKGSGLLFIPIPSRWDNCPEVVQRVYAALAEELIPERMKEYYDFSNIVAGAYGARLGQVILDYSPKDYENIEQIFSRIREKQWHSLSNADWASLMRHPHAELRKLFFGVMGRLKRNGAGEVDAHTVGPRVV